MALEIYGDETSGNCLKVKWVAEHLGVAASWRAVDVAAGETRTPEFLSINPFGKVPVLRLADGRILTESNAIIFHLAEGSALIPQDPVERATMLQWMFWEQYSHEPYIAVRRYLMRYLGRAGEEIDPALLLRGNQALAHMESTLDGRRYLAGPTVTLADVSLVAYTRLAHEGGFDLAQYPAVQAWVARVEGDLGIAD